MSESKYTSLVKKTIVANKLHKQAIETLVDSTGISRNRHHILMLIARRGKLTSQKEMAEHLGITQAAVTLALSKLEKDGLILRTSGADSRYNEITITDEGKRIVDRSREHFMKIDECVFSGFSEDELMLYEALITRIQDNLKLMLEKGENYV